MLGFRATPIILFRLARARARAARAQGALYNRDITQEHALNSDINESEEILAEMRICGIDITRHDRSCHLATKK